MADGHDMRGLLGMDSALADRPIDSLLNGIRPPCSPIHFLKSHPLCFQIVHDRHLTPCLLLHCLQHIYDLCTRKVQSTLTKPKLKTTLHGADLQI